MAADRTVARRLAAEAIDRGRPLEWFETLYRQADCQEAAIPWADMTINPTLAHWLLDHRPTARHRDALVVGCGLGDDAEALAAAGFDVTAFDISPSCIRWCQKRFASTSVRYEVADLLEPPDEWHWKFDLVLEIYTLQVLTTELRGPAMRQMASFVADNGTLLVVTRGRDPSDEAGQMPWPILRSELQVFVEAGLVEVNFAEFMDSEHPPVRRFCVQYRKPPTA